LLYIFFEADALNEDLFFLDITPCSLVEDWLTALMMEAASTSETLVNFYRVRGTTSRMTAILILVTIRI
jgi:hypothetical protein